ncbi:MAG TPA: hypothetical protein VIH48_01020 [Candidatus Bathyarchaeia archaeon]
MKRLRGKLHFKHAEALVFIAFFLLSLRVVNWFEYPYIIVSGDFRPPLVQQAFVNRVIYAWNEIDFGMPSVYSPRILDPFYFFTTISQAVGVNLYFAQIIAVFLLYFFASILMYMYVKQLTNGDTFASFIAAVFLVANVHLISDREQTAVGFIDTALMILPSLVTFTAGMKTRSYKLIAASGILFILTYGIFPNYRVALLCGIALGLTTLYLFISDGLKVSYQKASSKLLSISFKIDLIPSYLKRLLAFVASWLLSSLWIISMLITNATYLFGAYEEMAAPPFVLYIRPFDVPRLIAKWSFYESALGYPYVPYREAYISNPLIVILSYVPPIIAFASLLAFRSRKLTLYFGLLALVSLALTSGLNPFLSQLYFALATQIPLMLAFREPTNWIFFVVLAYSVLIGVGLSAVYHIVKNKARQFVILGLTIALFVYTTYPLVTGDVTRNWLNPDIKGSYFPPSYAEVNNILGNQYWAIILPQKGTYVIYNFTEGRRPLGCGNPYPLIFSNPVISGSGTEYVQPENPELIDKLYKLNYTQAEDTKFLGICGIKYLIWEKNVQYGNYTLNEPKLNESASLNLVNKWDEIELYNNNYALQKIYAADNILNYTTLDDIYNNTAALDWNILQSSVFIDTASSNQIINKSLATPKSFVWREFNPTIFEANVESNGPFFLVFLESYTDHWKLNVNGNQVSEANHLKANSFANCWLIENTGNLTLSLQYNIQSIFTESVAASIILPLILLAVLSRTAIRTTIYTIYNKLKRKIRNS